MRQSNERPRIDSLDGVRVLAIFGVIVIHLLLVAKSPLTTSTGLAGIATWGLLGNVIDIFFIVSGFLIFLPIVHRGGIGNLSDYALGRVARIAPPYWLCLAVVLVLAVLAPVAPYVAPSIGDLIVHGLGLQMPARMFDPNLAVGFGLDGPLWMISVIVGFYLVLPLVSRSYLRHPVAGLIAAALITLAWKELVVHSPGLFDSISNGSQPSFVAELIATDQLPGWLFSFALGMTGAWTYSTFSQQRLRAFVLHPAFIAASLIAYALFAYRYGSIASAVAGPAAGTASREHSLLALGSSISRAALISIVVLGPAWLQRPLSGGAIKRLSELTYGTYLIHVVVAVYLVERFGLSQDGSLATVMILFAVVLPVSLAYAWLSQVFLEQPILRRVKQRRTRGRRPASISGAPTTAHRA